VVYAARGPPIWAACFRDKPSKPLEALKSMMGTHKGREDGWESYIEAPTSKMPGTDVVPKTLRTFVPTAADLISAPPNRVAPLAAVVLLDACVELHPPGWVCSTSIALVDVEREPFPSDASRLSVRTLLAILFS
jgi:hypothetical protein